jgi:hypothetical protein
MVVWFSWKPNQSLRWDRSIASLAWRLTCKTVAPQAICVHLGSQAIGVLGGEGRLYTTVQRSLDHSVAHSVLGHQRVGVLLHAFHQTSPHLEQVST